MLTESDLKESAERINAGLEYFQNILSTNCVISMEPIKKNLQKAVIIVGHPLESYQKAPTPYLSDSLMSWKKSQLASLGLKRGDPRFDRVLLDIMQYYSTYTNLCRVLENRELSESEQETRFNVTNMLHERLALLHPDTFKQMPHLNSIAAVVNYHYATTWKCPTTRALLSDNTDIQPIWLFLLPFLTTTWKLALLEHHSIEKAYQDEMYTPFIDFMEKDLNIDLRDPDQLQIFQDAMPMPLLNALMRLSALGSREQLSSEEKEFVRSFKDWQLKRLIENFLPPLPVLRLIMQANVVEAEVKERADWPFGQRQNAMLTVFSQARNLISAQRAVLPEAELPLSQADFEREKNSLKYSRYPELRAFWAHLGSLSVPHPKDPDQLLSLENMKLRQNYVLKFTDKAYALYQQWKNPASQQASISRERDRRYQN